MESIFPTKQIEKNKSVTNKSFFNINNEFNIDINECLNSISRNNWLSKGSYSNIYCLRSNYIIKVYNESRYKFLDTTVELFILSQLSHPNILSCDFVAKHNNSIVFVLPKFQKTLLDVIPKETSDKESVMKQLVSGLNYLHSKNVLHLDLVPRNILVNINNGEFKISICDFSLSCLSFGEYYISKTPKISCDHRPYENLCGSKIYRIKSDIWSLGVIFYRIITGKKLFSFSTMPRENRKDYHFELSIRFEIEKRYYWNDWPPSCDSRIAKMLDLDIDKRIDSNSLCNLFELESLLISQIIIEEKTLDSHWLNLNKILKQRDNIIVYQVESLYKTVIETFQNELEELDDNMEKRLFFTCYSIINSLRNDIKFFIDDNNLVYVERIFEIFYISKGKFIKYI